MDLNYRAVRDGDAFSHAPGALPDVGQKIGINRAQWRTLYAKACTDPGVVALVLAVVSDGVRCLGGLPSCASTPSIKRDALADEARNWIFRERGRWPFSFHWCCEVLGFDPDLARAAIHDNGPAVMSAIERRGVNRVTCAPPVRRRKRTREGRADIRPLDKEVGIIQPPVFMG